MDKHRLINYSVKESSNYECNNRIGYGSSTYVFQLEKNDCINLLLNIEYYPKFTIYYISININQNIDIIFSYRKK